MEPVEKTENRVTLKFTSEVFRRLVKKRQHDETTFQAIGEVLFEDWLEGKLRVEGSEVTMGPRESAVNQLGGPERLKYCLKLLEYLDDPHEHNVAARALVGMVKAVLGPVPKSEHKKS